MPEPTFLSVVGRAIAPRAKAAGALSPPDNRDGWWGIIRESFTGAWQRNIEVRVDTVLTYSAVYACVTLIASDIAKLRPKLVEQGADGIWSEVASPAFSPVLRKPNHYQTRIQFTQQWITSKLTHGNTYALKIRDERGVVTKLYVLNPDYVTPLVGEDGSVFYRLHRDPLSGVMETDVTVPAREIIHDRMNTLYHPLVGVSPIYACGMAAVQGLRIQKNSALFFGSGSNPGGIISAPDSIGPDDARRVKEYWEANYTGDNVGKVAVLGDGMKFEATAVQAKDAQLIEQLRWTAENVCTCFHVPPYMIGVGPAPTYNNIEALNAQYYAQCLQSLIESYELCLDEGLGLVDVRDKVYGVELDLDGLLRMDTPSQFKAIADGIRGGFLTPNEGRRKLDLKPLKGGDTVYLQEQDHAIEALAARDANDPFAKPAAAAPVPPVEPDNDDGEDAKAMLQIMKGFA